MRMLPEVRGLLMPLSTLTLFGEERARRGGRLDAGVDVAEHGVGDHVRVDRVVHVDAVVAVART